MISFNFTSNMSLHIAYLIGTEEQYVAVRSPEYVLVRTSAGSSAFSFSGAGAILADRQPPGYQHPRGVRVSHLTDVVSPTHCVFGSAADQREQHVLPLL